MTVITKSDNNEGDFIDYDNGVINNNVVNNSEYDNDDNELNAMITVTTPMGRMTMEMNMMCDDEMTMKITIILKLIFELPV